MSVMLTKPPFNITVLTLYPEIFSYVPLLYYSIVKRAMERNLWQLRIVNIREFGKGRYKQVDDKPYGGGKGLLMRVDVVSSAIEYAYNQGASSNLIMLTPAGKPIKQKLISSLSKQDGMTIICGHFEGIDSRIHDRYNILELSLGDYVVSGGEIGAMALIDASIRMIPGALSSEACAEDESFSDGLLEYRQYTKPRDFAGLTVPEVLLSGHHANIKKWHKEDALLMTNNKRKDLLLQRQHLDQKEE